MALKIWRMLAIAGLAGCVILAVALALSRRIETVRVVTVEKIQTIKKNVYIERKEIYNPDTGRLALVTETTTDRSASENREASREIERNTPTARVWTVTAGYDITTGCFYAGAGLMFFDFISLQIANPVALRIAPIVLLSAAF